MQVSLIKQNLDDFQYLLQEKEEDYIDTLDKEGKEIKKWRIPTWKLYNSDEKSLKKRKDFNASSFFSGKLFMEKSLAEKMTEDFNLSVQLLPINTPEMQENFVFVNILGGVKAVIKHFWYTAEELEQANDKMNLFAPKSAKPKKEIRPELDGKYLFDSQIVAQNPIFRDKKFKGFYFCTDVFVKWAEENQIKGLEFENAGILKEEM